MTNFLLVRHGYSENNKEKKYTGYQDVDLDEVGYAQAEDVKKYVLENFSVDKVFSSDLKRACNTVKPIADNLGIDVIQRSDFKEIDVGEWQGLTFEYIQKKYPKEYQECKNATDDFCFVGGESFGELKKRFVSALEKLASENDGKTIVIGTHGGCVRACISHFKNIPIQDIETPSNGSITIVVFEKGNVTFEEIGYSEHLKNITAWKL